jgi:hypothetical protein
VERFEQAMSVALGFMERAANERDGLTKAALWSNAELWLAEAEAGAELERAGQS